MVYYVKFPLNLFKNRSQRYEIDMLHFNHRGEKNVSDSF